MIFNMKEEIETDRSGEDNDKAAVKEILLAAGAVISGESSGERVGKPEKHKPRPVKVRIGIVSDNLAKSKALRGHDKFNKVCISRSKEERIDRSKIVKELKQKRADKRYHIKHMAIHSAPT